LSQNDKQFCCVRCGQLQGVAADSSNSPANSRSTSTAEEPLTESARAHYDPWEVNEKLRHAERILQMGRRSSPGLDESLRFDPSIRSAPIYNAPVQSPVRRNSIATAAAWLLIASGTSGLSCGALLTAWSCLGDRADLWNLGLPIMVVGQMVLLLGLLVHFVRGGTATQNTEAPPQPPVFGQFPLSQQYRVDVSEIDARRADRGRNVQPPRD
jgi:hypothetical protein